MTPHPNRSAAPGGTARGLPRGCLAEEKTEPWTGGSKLGCRRHREVELQRVRKEEHAIGGRTALEVGKVHRLEFVDERARPVVEHLSDALPIGDAEGQIQVREAVAAVQGERPHGGTRNHTFILVGKPEEVLSESISLLNGEHQARVYFCTAGEG